MEDPDKESLRESDRTTIIQTDRDRGGGNGALIAVVALLVLGVLLFLLFGGGLGGGRDEGDVNVNIDAPEVSVPDVEMPDINVSLPDSVEVEVNNSE